MNKLIGVWLWCYLSSTAVAAIRRFGVMPLKVILRRVSTGFAVKKGIERWAQRVLEEDQRRAQREGERSPAS